MKRIRKQMMIAATGVLVAFLAATTPVAAEGRSGDKVAAEPSDAATPTALGALPLRELYTVKNGAYLYTRSWSEWKSAQSVNHLTASSKRPLGYLLSKPADDPTKTLAIYRLKSKATGAWLWNANADERKRLLDSKQFVMEGSGPIGYVYRDQAYAAKYGAKSIARFSNGKGWRIAYADQKTALVAAGYKYEGTMGYLLPQYYRVGAYYFGMFNQEGSSGIRAGTRDVYDRDDYWGGVRDFYGHDFFEGKAVPQNTQGWTGDFSYLKPEIGYYDNSNPDVLTQQIDQAVSHGLTYFNFYYYWNNQSKKAQIDGGLKAFLQAPNRDQMSFTISPCYHNYESQHLTLQPADFQTAAAQIADVTAQSNFLKTQDGRPIIFMCDPRGIDNGKVASINAYIGILRAAIKQKTGVAPFIEGHSELGLNTVKQYDEDGLTCLNYNYAVINNSQQVYLDHIKTYFATFDAYKPTQRCITGNFDERPRTAIVLPKASIHYFQDFTRAKFQKALQLTRESMQAAPASVVDNYVTAYSWNEWHEAGAGGILEPNVRDGDMFLNDVKSAFGLVEGSSG